MQRRIVDENRQVLVVFEGRSGRIMGRVINEFMNLMEPRGISYTHFIPEAIESPRDSLRYIAREPAQGKISIYDRSWYSHIISLIDEGRDVEELYGMARALERYFTNNNVIVVKIFLNISDETMDEVAQNLGKKRLKSGGFLVDDHIDPRKWSDKLVMSMVASTNTPFAPWDIVDVQNLDLCMTMVVHSFIQRVVNRLEHPYPLSSKAIESTHPNPRKDADLTKEAKSYKSELGKLSEEIAALQLKLAESDRSLVIVFEGWDAAGKGGSIKRLVRALNPRGYYVVPIAAPVRDERLHTHLWRFATKMPKKGHVVIFDRSWYGRMMVEPIEGLCTEDEYFRSAGEIRGFERLITEMGGIVIKFWMEISSEEQLARFQARQANPVKAWKITEEDWRNREKWDVYEEYVDRMIEATNTEFAPWVVVESEDKKYGRLKVLRTVRDVLSRELKD